MGLWKTGIRGPAIRGVPHLPIDCLGVVGQQDKPPVQLGGHRSSPQQLGEVNSLLPPGAASAGGQAGQEEGAGRALTETVLPSPNIWCQCSPKIERFLLPPRRKQCWKESQIQQGCCKEGSRSLAAASTSRGVTPGTHISLRQVPRDESCPDDPRGCRASQLPGAESHQHFPLVAGI